MDFALAKALIAEHALKLLPQNQPVIDALGMVIAKDILAPMDLPPFDNSAVDGFALHSLDMKSLPVVGEIRAVGQKRAEIKAGQAFKIMTGAPLPLGTQAVIMKEEVEFLASIAHLKRLPHLYENLRFLGEDIKKHQLLLKAGTKVKPQALGLLLALGIDEVEVFTPPKVRIIATGDELVNAPTPLKFGQAYHLMGPMLKAALADMAITDVQYVLVADRQDNIACELKKALDADIILLTGGISQGEHDLVKPVLQGLGVKEIFHQGAWRPGKPLYFGRKDQVRIFGLPGNPVSAFTCFHIFVKALLAQSFQQNYEPNTAILLNDFKMLPVTFFAHARLTEGLQIGEQGSHRIFGLSKANALCLVPKGSAIVKAGERVKYYPI